jgi:trk system potassium uptake protein TrkA
MTFRHGEANLVEWTLPPNAPFIGQRVGSVPWPVDTALVVILREGRVITPSRDDPLEGGDELLFVAAPEVEGQLRNLLLHGPAPATR